MILWAHPSPQPKLHLHRFCTAHRKVSTYFTMGRKIAPSHGDVDAHLITLSWAHPSPQTKQHLNRYCRGGTVTDGATDHATWSVTIGHIYIHSTAKWLNNDKLLPCRTNGQLLLSGFQAFVTLTLDPVIRHTIVRQSSTSVYTEFQWIRKNFCVDGLTAGMPSSSRSCDTKKVKKTRTNIKNPTRRI